MTIAKGTIHILTGKGSDNTPNKYSDLYPKTSADQVTDLDTTIEEKVTSMISYDATKTSGDVIGILNINGTDHVLYSTPDTHYTVATTSTNGLMSAADKARLDNLADYTLPTASTSVKGGIIIGDGLQMDGDTLNVMIQNSSGGGGNIGTLDTVPATVDGGLWYEVTDSMPTLWFHKGNYDYRYSHDKLRYSGDAIENLVAYLPFTSTLDDVLGNEWTATGNPALSVEQTKFANKALYLDGNSWLTMNNGLELGGQDFTIDMWVYIITTAYGRVFEISAENNREGSGFTRYISAHNSAFNTIITGSGFVASTVNADDGVWHHCALTYKHAEQTTYAFADGQLISSLVGEIPRTLFKNIFISQSNYYNQYGHFKGYCNHFRIHDGIALWTENFTSPTVSDYPDSNSSTTSNTIQSGSSSETIGTLDTVPSTVDGDIWYELFNGKPVLKMRKGDYNYVFENSKIQRVTASEYLVAWLRFNQSTTYDECGIHTWETIGSPTIGATNSSNGHALQLDADSYVQCTNGITLGERDFTVDCWFYCNNENPYYAEIFNFGTTIGDTSYRIGMAITNGHREFGFVQDTGWVRINGEQYLKLCDPVCQLDNATSGMDNFTSSQDYLKTYFTQKLLHSALVYKHDRRRIFGFLNGRCFQSRQTSMFETSKTYLFVKIGKGHPDNTKFTGAISEFRIHDGIALWTQDFIPPTASDY